MNLGLALPLALPVTPRARAGWLGSQPRTLRHGIPRRIRAQHLTQMTVHVRELNRGTNLKQSTSKQNSKSRSKSLSRRPGTTTFEFAFYSAAAIKLDQLKSPGLSSCRSSFTTCITVTSHASMSTQRLCCTAPHCASWPHPKTGRSPGRPIAVVVYLIRPNRGLTAVLQQQQKPVPQRLCCTCTAWPHPNRTLRAGGGCIESPDKARLILNRPPPVS